MENDRKTIGEFVIRLIRQNETNGDKARRKDIVDWIKSEANLRQYDENIVDEYIAELLP